MRVYLPYGRDWYAYLVRRLAERPANVAFFLRSLQASRAVTRPGLVAGVSCAPMIGIFGAGKMGEALISGLLRAGRPPSEVIAVVRRADRAAELRIATGSR